MKDNTYSVRNHDDDSDYSPGKSDSLSYFFSRFSFFSLCSTGFSSSSPFSLKPLLFLSSLGALRSSYSLVAFYLKAARSYSEGLLKIYIFSLMDLIV